MYIGSVRFPREINAMKCFLNAVTRYGTRGSRLTLVEMNQIVQNSFIYLFIRFRIISTGIKVTMEIDAWLSTQGLNSTLS